MPTLLKMIQIPGTTESDLEEPNSLATIVMPHSDYSSPVSFNPYDPVEQLACTATDNFAADTLVIRVSNVKIYSCLRAVNRVILLHLRLESALVRPPRATKAVIELFLDRAHKCAF